MPAHIEEQTIPLAKLNLLEARGLMLKFSTRRRSLPYTSSEKQSALVTSWGSMSVPARISITENASLGTTWHRADALVIHPNGGSMRRLREPIKDQQICHPENRRSGLYEPIGCFDSEKTRTKRHTGIAACGKLLRKQRSAERVCE